METKCLKFNSQGGKKISILKTGNYQIDKQLEDQCLKKSKGLYIWTHITNINFIENNNITSDIDKCIIANNDFGVFVQNGWVKPGQYGQNTEFGISPIDTIDGYTSGQYDEIIILKIFNDMENPYQIEQKSWHQNPIFKSRKVIHGGGFEKINAPISEIIDELSKNLNISIEKFNEKNISKDIRFDLFNKITFNLKINKKFTFSYLLHMRFAKTGFYLQLVNDLGKYDDSLLFILYSDDYTVYGSYKNWIEDKKCWGDSIKFIDCSKSDNPQNEVLECKANGIIPFIKVGTKTPTNKIDFLKEVPSVKKIVLIEEADYGTWTSKSSEKLEYLDSIGVVITSGTGIDKASYNKEIDHLFLYDIIDGYMVKNGIHPIYNKESYKNDYMNFPSPKVYDINFSLALQNFQKNLTGDSKTKLNKLFKDPVSNSSYIKSFFKSVLCIPDINNINSFNFYNNRKNSFGYRDDIDNNVSLCYLPGGMKNKDIESIKNILISDKEIESRFEIIIISGDETSREESEKFTKGKLIEFKNNGKNKSVIILASNMAKRSYSISEIKNVFLMFDGGSDTSVEQIIARAMTEGYQYNGLEKNEFNIICCSVDPNREKMSVIEMFLINKIAKAFNNYNMSTEESTRLILSVFPLNLVDENGIEFQKIGFDDFIKRNPKSQMYLDAAKAGINLDLLPDDIIKTLENSGLKSDFIDSISKTKLDLKGLKSILNKKKKSNNSNKNIDERDEIDKSIKILEAIIVIIESSFNISLYIEQNKSFSILETLNYINNDRELNELFKIDFGIETEVCIFVINSGCINEKLINAGIDEQIIEIEYDEM